MSLVKKRPEGSDLWYRSLGGWLEPWRRILSCARAARSKLMFRERAY
jgi:hypothetical protein